ncbi:hypothetical protein QQS21_007662 [Conoideocrella luteorostrata]|uniref:BTB domain-containing protein n=1 Tax=Conoideocrella luteorostrata TaxID=1105319 RepID=A0AAJ0CKN8_9HYPO|nr:hypothetical protein QQS21_007662 [Conoideocrella luteorostrata]
MASLPYGSITSSPLFTFLVGPDQKEHTIHSALVAHQSKALNALVNGHMKEATERRVVWKETSEDTFIRFSQYAYTGSYDEAEPHKREDEETSPDPDKIEETEQNEAITLPSNTRRPKKEAPAPQTPFFETKRERLWDTFNRLHTRKLAKPEQRITLPDDDYTHVFLCHAQVYVFADYHGIDALQSLALHKLRRALTQFVLFPGGRSDISKLVQYTFNETGDKGEQADALRSLVCFYTACKADDLWKSAEFQDLTRTVPEFSKGFINVLLNRLD